jgi:hypothetical protein
VGKIDKVFSPKEYEEKILDWWNKEKIYMKKKKLNISHQKRQKNLRQKFRKKVRKL